MILSPVAILADSCSSSVLVAFLADSRSLSFLVAYLADSCSLCSLSILVVISALFRRSP
jgi:hypothetical protein